MLVRPFRILVAAACAVLAACGGESPTAPSARIATEQDRLLVDAGTPSASLLPDRNGGPGLIRYNLCYAIRVPGGVLGTTKTIQHLEYWLIGPEGSVYHDRVSQVGVGVGAHNREP